MVPAPELRYAPSPVDDVVRRLRHEDVLSGVGTPHTSHGGPIAFHLSSANSGSCQQRAGVIDRVVAGFAVGGAATASAAAGDGQLGGPPDSGGIADDTVCADGEAVTAVTGATRIVGGFIPIVAVATVECTGGSVAGGTMGGGEGAPGSTSCPDGQVAVGITGREGDFVDYLALRCRNADGSGPITTSVGFGGWVRHGRRSLRLFRGNRADRSGRSVCVRWRDDSLRADRVLRRGPTRR